MVDGKGSLVLGMWTGVVDRMKLISFRDKDRMHLRDLIAVGLVDEAWPGRFPVELARRLQAILDDPEG